MKNFKKIAAMILALAMGLSLLAACGSSSSSTTAATTAAQDETTTAAEGGNDETEAASEDETEAADPYADVTTSSHKIVVYTLKANGSIVEGVEAFLSEISDDLNFTYEVRFAGDDAATFLNNCETAINEGFEGIITMTDKGNCAAILELCEEYGVYFGCTWSNNGSSLNSSDAGYDILKSDYYLAAISDGQDSYGVEVESYAAAIAEAYEALDDDKKDGSIGITTNPSAWTPGQQLAAENMYQTLTGEYDIPESAFATEGIEKRTEDATYAGQTLEAGTWQFLQVDVSSKSLPTSYFQSNPNLSLICSFASITYIEPALQTAGLHGKVKVWTCGYESEDYLMNNFGSEGDQTYQGFRTAPIEDVAYPLVQILDRLEGNSYADRTAKVEELVSAWEGGDISSKFALKNYLIPASSSIVVTEDDQFEAFKTGYVYGTGNGADSIVTANDLKGLMVTYNPEATFDDLVAFFNYEGDLTVDAIK